MLALTPFGHTSRSKGRERAFDCRSPVSFVAAKDPALAVAGIVREGGSAAPTAAAPSREDIQRLRVLVADADRYRACHRPATRRLLLAGVVGLVGAWAPLQWWYRRRRPVERAYDQQLATSFGYHPALDGVRAVSILMVLARHLGLRGVFISGDHGVDIFFVLSGFLITTLVLREHTRTGRINLRHFYMRRVLRLYPVVIVVLAIGVTVRVLGPAFSEAPGVSGLLATTFYYANWMHGWNARALGFLSPTWSLSIEEQFYLVWPPLVVALLARRRAGLTIGVTAAAGALAAAAYRAWIWCDGLHWSPAAIADADVYRSVVALHRAKVFDRWYFSSFAHADTLLVGCLLAVVLTPSVVAALRARPKLVLGLGWLAALTIGYLCLRETLLGNDLGAAPGDRLVNADFVPIWGQPLFEICVAAVLLALVTIPTGLMTWVLSQRTLTWIGRRSYGLYVLHLPAFVLVTHTNVAHGYPRMALQLTAAFVVAALSFRFIEAPTLALKGRFRGGAGRPEPKMAPA